jgi:hypothetical protein
MLTSYFIIYCDRNIQVSESATGNKAATFIYWRETGKIYENDFSVHLLPVFVWSSQLLSGLANTCF